jgi:hypothetical protein
MQRCAICILRIELPWLPKRARFLSEPPPNFDLFLHLRNVFDHLHRRRRAIQIVANLGKSANKT